MKIDLVHGAIVRGARSLLASPPNPPAHKPTAAVLLLLVHDVRGIEGSGHLSLDQHQNVEGVPGSTRILFERRPTNLPAHAGEVCFPGGKVKPGEALKDAAVREAKEEVGVDNIVVLDGSLPFVSTPVSKNTVSPFVGLWTFRSDAQIQRDEREVGEVLLPTINELCDGYNQHGKVLVPNWGFWKGPTFTLKTGGQDTVIWGLTGRILDGFLRGIL